MLDAGIEVVTPLAHAMRVGEGAEMPERKLHRVDVPSNGKMHHVWGIQPFEPNVTHWTMRNTRCAPWPPKRTARH